MKTPLLLNPAPGFGECLAADRWMKEKCLAPSDVEFRFWDLDGDGDPSVRDIGVRSAPTATDAAADGQLVLPKLIRGAWRLLRDDAGGKLPARGERLALVDVALRAARLANEGVATRDIFGSVALLGDLQHEIDRRSAEAERAVAGRRMTSKKIAWHGQGLHVTYLWIASGFEARAAFRAMPGISLLVSNDARVKPARTAVMAREGLDLTALIEPLHQRLVTLDPGCWDLLPGAKPGPSPMILPARRQTEESRLGGNEDVMFALLQECAAG